MEATGYLREDPSGLELVFERTLTAPVAEVWASFTTPEGTAAWIGTWAWDEGQSPPKTAEQGDAFEGRTVTFTMNAEESAEPEQVTIIDCQPPHRLQAAFASEAGTWHLRVDLHEVDGTTQLVFAHLLRQGDEIRSIGPGWDYYLDRLVAAHTGAPMPDWSDYWPDLTEHYLELG
ncbi:SRPBCC domain-containing protein [Ruania alba]|uniref:Activator of Hsp90 ATPase homolog 1-like protein n=1 Tax=Ruania alba TaxID=648782 RepID=A0A1H5EXQ4_9MICO|nr:SRPBCC domain-containing protein [Ruania alba]SED95839.1 Activator of Hsp90 ATPase homolog 1-like protein [Ruania alba]